MSRFCQKRFVSRCVLPTRAAGTPDANELYQLYFSGDGLDHDSWTCALEVFRSVLQ